MSSVVAAVRWRQPIPRADERRPSLSRRGTIRLVRKTHTASPYPAETKCLPDG